MRNLVFGSVCSGIEAASVAWHPLGWQAAWFSEIEPFPCAVLAHHYPDVPNLGDMTPLPDRIRSGEVEAPDLFCGGTPCQAFSVAGLRQSLADDRGNLSLTFCEIANAIDTKRDQPCIVFWENVPGVLSTKDNAFGCFLAGLAGENAPLVAPGGRWSNAGFVDGPKRAVAWRVLDAQYFGVAQRRRRVFVVASARADFDPAAVLFEFDGVRRDFAPSRETGQEVAGTFTARAKSGGWGQNPNLAAGGYMQPVAARMVAFGEYVDDGTASAMKARDYKDATDLVAQAVVGTIEATLGRSRGAGTPLSAVVQTVAFAQNQLGEVRAGDVFNTINTNGNASGRNTPMVQTAMQVRRLTPVECERLQGFPDGYTNIPWRKKSESPDGPRYKALGNSWAVPVVRWIGERIDRALD
jgi:DNA (cytosine-5)-methyltransferase 1